MAPKAPIVAGGKTRLESRVKKRNAPFYLQASCADCTTPDNTVLRGVLFGEVWMCSGQSNMEAMVEVTFARNQTYASADAGDYSRVRLWQTPWRPMKQPTYILPPLGHGGRPQTVNWASPSNVSLPAFSAVCWYVDS